jgi:hypothetical protein
VLRRGIRALAGQTLGERQPGWSLGVLSGLLPGAPPDLAERHDAYLADALEDEHPRPR